MSDLDIHALSRCYGRVFTGCALVVPGATRRGSRRNGGHLGRAAYWFLTPAGRKLLAEVGKHERKD